MSRILSVTGHHSDLREALIQEGFEVTYFDTSEPALGSRVFFRDRRVGSIQADPTSTFGDATLSISTGWCPLIHIIAALHNLEA